MLSLTALVTAFTILHCICCVLAKTTRLKTEYRDECGAQWQRTYRQRVSLLRRDGSSQRRLIIVPRYKRDAAESLMAYISGFMWALLTHRDFFILNPELLFDCDASALTNVYSSPSINWNANPAAVGLSKELLLNLSALPIHIKSENGSNVVNLVSHESAKLTRMSELNFNAVFDPSHSEDSALLSLDESLLLQLFTTPHHKDALHTMGFRPETAFGCIFHFLFRFKRTLCSGPCASAEDKLLQAGRDGVARIGVQLSLECSAAPQYDFCLQNLLSEYSKRDRKVIILFVTESLHIQRVFKEKYGDQLILPTGEPAHPKDFIPQDIYDKPLKSPLECDRIRSLDEHRTLQTARNIHLLSLTDVQIVSLNGALGLVAALTQLKRNRTVFGVGIDHKERRNCSLHASDDLRFFADQWRMGV